MNQYVEVEYEEFFPDSEYKGAAHFTIDGEDVWIPWSQVEGDRFATLAQYNGRISITKWIANQKELIYEDTGRE